MHRALVLACALAGCGTDSASQDPPLYPEDYAATYQEVRDCRFSLDHDLTRMRVLASPEALASYTDRTAPFPTGAIVLKEQFEGDDTACSGPIITVTVMQRLDTGSSPDTLDWTWQQVDSKGDVETVDIKRCTSCHTGCGSAPEGFDGTCAMP
jgi:Cytochrome P460